MEQKKVVYGKYIYTLLIKEEVGQYGEITDVGVGNTPEEAINKAEELIRNDHDPMGVHSFLSPSDPIEVDEGEKHNL